MKYSVLKIRISHRNICVHRCSSMVMLDQLTYLARKTSWWFFSVESNNEKNISFSFGSWSFFVFVCFNVQTDPNIWSYPFVNVMIDFAFFINYNTKTLYTFFDHGSGIVIAKYQYNHRKCTVNTESVLLLPINLIASKLS
jgi:hypothetical protein